MITYSRLSELSNVLQRAATHIVGSNLLLMAIREVSFFYMRTEHSPTMVALARIVLNDAYDLEVRTIAYLGYLEVSSLPTEDFPNLESFVFDRDVLFERLRATVAGD